MPRIYTHQKHLTQMNAKLLSTIVLASSLTMFNCSAPEKKSESANVKPETPQKELIARGKYLVTVAGCNDCHSPKLLTPHGVAIDTTRALSGHPANEALAPIVKTQDWILFNNGLT